MVGKQINLGSPKQLQDMLFDELGMPKTKRTRTGYTTDADALQQLYEQDRAPVPGPPAHPPRRHPAQADRRGSAQVGRRRRPDPHDLHPDDRGDRPALQHRPQPAEHPDPDRGGPPDPARRSSSGTASRRLMTCRLQPDRDADHGARRARTTALIEAFKSGMDFHAVTASRVFGVAPDAGRREERAKIKAMNYGLAYGLSRVRPQPTARHRHRPRRRR